MIASDKILDRKNVNIIIKYFDTLEESMEERQNVTEKNDCEGSNKEKECWGKVAEILLIDWRISKETADCIRGK